MKYTNHILPFLLCVASCSQIAERQHEPKINMKSDAFLNTYRVFDEPIGKNVLGLNFYLLIVSSHAFDSTHLISIKQDSDIVYGSYKTASFSQINSIQRIIDFDTTTFIYSTVHFKLVKSEIDSLKNWLKAFNISGLKDSVSFNHLDGGMREIILFDGDNTYHIYRSFGAEKELEGNLNSFINKIKDRYISALENYRR